jgi:hypothetical protein
MRPTATEKNVATDQVDFASIAEHFIIGRIVITHNHLVRGNGSLRANNRDVEDLTRRRDAPIVNR